MLGLPPFIGIFECSPNDPICVSEELVDLWLPPGFGDPGIFSPFFGGNCSVFLADTTASAFPGGFFVPQSLEAFDATIFDCSGGATIDDEGLLVPIATLSGRITTWVVTPPGAPAIPEPAGFVVFAIGAGMVGLARHRRSRKN